jgi:hypothetical protein
MGSVKSTHKAVVWWQKGMKQSRRADQRDPMTNADLLNNIREILARHVGDDDSFIRHLRKYLEEHR